MRDLNLWIGTGRLGRMPELRHSQSGKAVCSVSMACGFDDKVEWINLVFWDKQAELVAQHCEKGAFIRVSGRLQTKEWTDKQGEKRYTTEIVASEVQFLGGKGEKQEYTSKGQNGPTTGGYDEDNEGDVPF